MEEIELSVTSKEKLSDALEPVVSKHDLEESNVFEGEVNIPSNVLRIYKNDYLIDVLSGDLADTYNRCLSICGPVLSKAYCYFHKLNVTLNELTDLVNTKNRYYSTDMFTLNNLESEFKLLRSAIANIVLGCCTITEKNFDECLNDLPSFFTAWPFINDGVFSKFSKYRKDIVPVIVSLLSASEETIKHTRSEYLIGLFTGVCYFLCSALSKLDSFYGLMNKENLRNSITNMLTGVMTIVRKPHDYRVVKCVYDKLSKEPSCYSKSDISIICQKELVDNGFVLPCLTSGEVKSYYNEMMVKKSCVTTPSNTEIHNTISSNATEISSVLVNCSCGKSYEYKLPRPSIGNHLIQCECGNRFLVTNVFNNVNGIPVVNRVLDSFSASNLIENGMQCISLTSSTEDDKI